MQVRERLSLTLALSAALAAGVAACGGASPGVAEPAVIDDGPPATVAMADGRPAVLQHLPLVELVGPTATNAGPVPVFEWQAVSGADAYRLSVRGPGARTWAWTGEETSVRYGGVAEGQAGPTIIPGSVWSVAALGSDGSLLALSGLRSVSPTDDVGPAPDWLAAPATAHASGQGDAEAEAPPAGEIGVCDLLSADDITAVIEGTWGEPMLAYGSGLAGGCQWTSANGSILSIDVMPAATYDPEGWGADGTVDRLGERSYVVSHGWDRKIGFVHGERSVMITIDWTRVDLDAFASIAREVEKRLP